MLSKMILIILIKLKKLFQMTIRDFIMKMIFWSPSLWTYQKKQGLLKNHTKSMLHSIQILVICQNLKMKKNITKNWSLVKMSLIWMRILVIDLKINPELNLKWKMNCSHLIRVELTIWKKIMKKNSLAKKKESIKRVF